MCRLDDGLAPTKKVDKGLSGKQFFLSQDTKEVSKWSLKYKT